MSLRPGNADAANILRAGVAAGINHIDTADLYDAGANEELVGEALKGSRNRIFLATKVGNQLRADGSGWDWNPRKQYILEAVDKSLRRLQTDHIDLYQLHGGTIEDPIGETIEAFELLKQQGKIRYYGISSIRPNVIREWVNRSALSSVMMQYSLLDRRPEEECLDFLARNNIAVFARGSLAQGMLVDKPAKEYLGRTVKEVEQVSAFLKSQGGNTSSLAIRFVLQHPAVTSAVVGIRTMDQLKEALQAASMPSLPNNLYEGMKKTAMVNYYSDHR